MELYQAALNNPMAFIGRDLATEFYAKVTNSTEPPQYGGIFDKELFTKFTSQFNCISITAGLPKNDYGQTVRLSGGEKPRLDEMEWRAIPPHLIRKQLSLKPDEMSGRYGYQKLEDARGLVLSVKESFFFEFRDGYHPETFSKLTSSLAALRYLSSILHKLDLFKVVLVENGTYVQLRARVADSYKPTFAMNS